MAEHIFPPLAVGGVEYHVEPFRSKAKRPNFCPAAVNYTILYHTILFHTILYYTILYYTILYYTILLCYTIVYYTILCYTMLFYAIYYKQTGQGCAGLGVEEQQAGLALLLKGRA